MKYIASLFLAFTGLSTQAQVTTNPTCFAAADAVTIIYDATQGTSGLVGATKVYMHAGVITDSQNGTSWQHVVGNWGQDDGIGQMTKMAGESDKWQITITPRTYFNVPASETIYRLGMVFRNADGTKEGKNDANGDIFVNLAQDAVNLQITSTNPMLVNTNDVVSITATTCSNATYTLYINNVLETTALGTSQFSYNYTVQQPAGTEIQVKLIADVAASSNTQTFSFAVRQPTVVQPRPAGITDGINYDTDPTKATLSLWAPFKTSVYVVGSFNNWSVSPAYQMKQDGEHFWLEINGLTPGQEYAYQYLVDETIWIADPYADKILDPDDQWIPESTYPNLMPYPAGATHANWYQNRAAILQTNQTEFAWQNANFKKPPQENLVIYQVLVRDFLGPDNMNYQALIDTLGYIQKLGVNAIQLLPIMEFGGNDSWGYNPTFMFAVDKAYGTKNDLKAFIDAAHGRGMAVILDMVMNHNDIPSPYAQMYFDFTNFKPTAQNPWFNTDAKHPFNVFFDINHESSYTQAWLDTITTYWVNEYRFDGFRFDLSKGFTQQESGGDVSKWSQKDDSRIALLKRMADKIWANNPKTYIILEHFADNTEETILADYGMMLWGNGNYDYNEITMGYADNKSIAWTYFGERGWSKNNLVSYMESHDEERLMFKNLEYGNTNGSYSVKDVNVALQRNRAAAAFFFTVPGPKHIWQFGEFGYDVSIDENGRTGRKPTKWEYLQEVNHKLLFDTYKELIALRTRYSVFTQGDFTWQPQGAFKSIHIANADTSIAIIGNFDVTAGTINPQFQHTGTWYDFFRGKATEVTDVNATISLAPGEFRIYTDVPLHTPNVVLGLPKTSQSSSMGVYPNPAQHQLFVVFEGASFQNNRWVIVDIMGKQLLNGTFANAQDTTIDIAKLPMGLYTLKIKKGGEVYVQKFIKN